MEGALAKPVYRRQTLARNPPAPSGGKAREKAGEGSEGLENLYPGTEADRRPVAGLQKSIRELQQSPPMRANAYHDRQKVGQ